VSKYNEPDRDQNNFSETFENFKKELFQKNENLKQELQREEDQKDVNTKQMMK
jgi:hypothetical protein